MSADKIDQKPDLIKNISLSHDSGGTPENVETWLGESARHSGVAFAADFSDPQSGVMTWARVSDADTAHAIWTSKTGEWKTNDLSFVTVAEEVRQDVQNHIMQEHQPAPDPFYADFLKRSREQDQDNQRSQDRDDGMDI